MIERFQDDEHGKRRLIDALKKQIIVANEAVIAEAIFEKGALIEIKATDIEKKEFIKQDDHSNDLFLIITGKVAIYINGRQIAERGSGLHVGEMALIDPTKRRSATNTVTEDAVLMRISEEDFTSLAQAYPDLWRRLALELSNRLRERSRYIYQPNPKPIVFIGCSVEQLSIAETIQLKLQHANNLIARIWTDNVFEATQNSIDSLLNQARESDFAVMIFSRDDTVVSRTLSSPSPRDNVIFEFGLFMGAIGKDRAVFVKPFGHNLKIPSDLYGVTSLEYNDQDPNNLISHLGPVCTEIKRIVTEHGAK